MAGGDDSVMWLRVKDEDIDAAELLRVKVSTTGSGKKRWFVCTGTLYKGKDDHMREYSRAQKKVKADPRNDEGLQLELQRGMMAIFRKQQRDREADNLVDSEEDGDDGQPDDGGEHAFASSIPPPSFSSCCAHAPLIHTTLRSLSLSLLSYCLSRTSQVGGARRNARRRRWRR
jgi:hypothetical protein